MDITLIKQYLSQVKQRFQAGGATEHSYRGDLENLLKELAQGVKITNEPKREVFGAPDYVIKRQGIPIGYIEAKDINVDLNKVEKSEQMGRYLKSLDNLILTDYLEFRFFRYGEKVKEIKIASAFGKFTTYPDHYRLLIDYITDFCDFEGQTITSAEKLSKLMAQKARIMEKVLLNAIKTDHEDNTLRDHYKVFKEMLIHDLSEENFADIYAQTITYGMFAARLHDPVLETFTRFEAAQLIPKSNPFLRKLFQYIAGNDLDNRIAWIVEALADVFRVTDVATLIKNLGDVTKQNDPMIHFYETFLAEYDPKLRKKRGVWYTPEPVVNFMVRAVDDILKSEFGLYEGLADSSKIEIKLDVQGKKEKQEVHKVQILDPTVGTGTFLAEIIKLIYKRYKAQQGTWNDYVENHLIPRLNGFELLMAPYAMAHLKLDLLLSETGFKPTRDQRLRVYLTNALEEYHPDTGTIFASWLSQEANEANFIKRDTPVMVVIGNPPYSVSSANTGDWIRDLIAAYKEGLNEKKINIDDDYIKFIRYGQNIIDRDHNSEGILALITNNSFLDGLTHRQMRKYLLQSFEKIYVLDLHGSIKRRDKAKDGGKDENVFDIQQGVSISIFIKKNTRDIRKKKPAQIFYKSLLGLRELKYSYLISNSIESVDWVELNYCSPYYFFVPKDYKNIDNYEKGFKIDELFTQYNSGIQTKKDRLSIQIDKVFLQNIVNDFKILNVESLKNKYQLKDTTGWSVNRAKEDIMNNDGDYYNINYRPFDIRNIYMTKYNGFVGRPRFKTMKNFLLGQNIGLITVRQQSTYDFQHAIITKNIIESGAISLQTKEWGYVFPLYLYNDEEESTILSEIGQPNRNPNLNMKIVEIIEGNLSLSFTLEKEETEGTFAPIDILDYIYALLHSPSYRDKYKEFLKIDFPRIPYPNDRDNFWQLVSLGEELRQIHLLESPIIEEFISSYPENGSNEVGKINYENEKVWINSQQYFEGVTPTAWEFYIGGYQPAQKWLKDRKGRVLGFDDVRHYHKIIKALVETDRIMKEIDKVTADWI